ncbi:UvrD-helicase domain-containing protein [Streptomyces sp. SID3343]|nr:UvrD-helicase domain-containing protein [Streptomyces sp. SID3343]MYW00044.1 UvrD-helicase domain-containing protein [Streptomyces sp. SID3343]
MLGRELIDYLSVDELKTAVRLAESACAAIRELEALADAATPAAPSVVPPVKAAPAVAAAKPAKAAPGKLAVGGFAPTAEQTAIVDAFVAGRHLVVEARAGTGKTSTLRLAAQAMPNKKGLYVAYNKAIQVEAAASFPASVQCKTAHSLAFGGVGRLYKHRLDGPRLPARESARRLGVDDALKVGAHTFTAEQLTRLALGMVDRYCQSDDTEIDARHLEWVNGVTPLEHRRLGKELLPYANRAWTDLQDVNGRLRFTHDHYLKMWALTGPQLRADFVLYDEAQDANPVITGVVRRQQGAQQVAVGDTCQAIYGWRGAVDALATWPADERLYLAQSFRFGHAIAAQANTWLDELGAAPLLIGNPNTASTVGPLETPKALLCRTNARAIRSAMDYMDSGRTVGLVGGGTAIRRLAEAARDLKNGRRTSHPELFVFDTWEQVREYVRDEDAGGLGTFVRLIDDEGPEAVIAAVGRLSDEKRAQVVVSTAHKAKGREWDSVAIADDFSEPSPDRETGEPGPIPREEAMLAYVALTRAKLRLDPEGLSWIHNRTHGRRPAGIDPLFMDGNPHGPGM